MPAPDPLRKILESVFHENVISGQWKRDLSAWMSARAGNADLIRAQLADAIFHDTISPDEYRYLTGSSVRTQDDVRAALRKIWREYYGYEARPEEK